MAYVFPTIGLFAKIKGKLPELFFNVYPGEKISEKVQFVFFKRT